MKRAEQQVEKKAKEFTVLDKKYGEAQEQLLELEQDSGMKTTVSERELNK